MSNRRWFAGVAALAGVFGIADWRGSVRANQELDPLKVAADTHKVLFENALVRVIEAKVPPGKSEPRHRHPRSVTVYMSDYEIEQTTFPEGKKTRAIRKHGTV